MRLEDQTNQQQRDQHPPSNDTETNRNNGPSVIVETIQHRRFAEFCDVHVEVAGRA